MTNKSGDNHPVHLHRHTFEVTKIGDKTTAGLMKDTINMTRFSSLEIDFVADDPWSVTAPLPPSGSHGRRLHGHGDLSLMIAGSGCDGLWLIFTSFAAPA